MFQNITEKINSTSLLFEIVLTYSFFQSVSNITRLYAEQWDVAKNVCIRRAEEDRI